MARDKRFVVSYDNFNFKDTVRDQVLGSSRAVMRNLTTAIAVENPHLPADGLRQDQLPYDKPLHFLNIICSPTRGLCYDGTAKAMARHFIAAALRYLHPSAIYRIFGSGDARREPDIFEKKFAMPTIDVLEAKKTPVHLLGTVLENEATVSGSARVHSEIFLEQLRLGRPDVAEESNDAPDDSFLDTAPEFAEQLFLVYGDQITAARIRGVKFGQRSARRAFDRRDWLLGPPVWFHTMQALLNLIVRTHWQPDDAGQYSRATLVHDITYLDRHSISKDSFKYHQFQPLITQGFRARIAALFYQSLTSKGLLESGASQKASVAGRSSRDVYERYYDRFDAAVRKLTADEFERHVDLVCDAAFSRSAWHGKGIEDLEFVTMCRFLQEALLFMELQHAVKFGDIGLLRRLVDPLAVMFFGSDQHKYGYEMLHLRWLLHHAHVELQHAVLAGGLVNERGEEGGFLAIDIVLEFINLYFADDMKKHKNSTHNAIATFLREAYAHDELRQVQAAFELNYGKRTKSEHSYKRAEGDVFNLTVFLLLEGCTVPAQRVNHGRQFLSCDVFSVGFERLPANVAKFNVDILRLPDASGALLQLMSGMSTSGDGDDESAPSMAEDAVGDELEAIDDGALVVHESVLDTLNIANEYCCPDADVGQVLEDHIQENKQVEEFVRTTE